MRTFHGRFSLVILASLALHGCGKKGEASEIGSTDQPAAILPDQRAANDGIVRAVGSHFELDGRPFFFAGTSLYNLALLDGHSAADIDQQMALVAKAGIKVVRIWGFCNGDWNGTKALQVHPGVFSEEAARRFDFVLAKAETHHLKLIVALANFEPEYGGFDWYVREVLGEGKSKDLFLTDGRVKAAYKAYVAFVLNRRNTITGRLYKDEPGVMAWELANEPKATLNFEIHEGIVPGSLLLNWAREMSAYVKSIDPRHMVSTGEEGYSVGGELGPKGWISDGSKGEDFAKNVALPTIDFATAHTYPDAWNIKPSEIGSFVTDFYGDRMKLVSALNGGRGKPFVIEEIGFVKAYGDRNAMLNKVFSFANGLGAAGLIVWRMVPYEVDGVGYDFTFTQSGSAEMLRQVGIMGRLSQ